MIKVWRSYACNNSGASRLIARFADPAIARDTAAELYEYFVAQERVANQRNALGPLETLARTYGFRWNDSGAGEEGPGVFAFGDALIVYQSYGLGLGPGVVAFVEDRGGVPESDAYVDLPVSVLFRAGDHADEITAVLAALDPDLAGKVPWARFAGHGPVAWFRDAGSVGLSLQIRPADFLAFKQWLGERGVGDPAILIDQDDHDLFAAIAKARCTACEGPLEYLDPRLHDIEAPQLVCKPCGGLYDLTAFR